MCGFEIPPGPDLSRLFRLYNRFPEDLPPIADMVCSYIRRRGAAVIDKPRVEGAKEEAKDSGKPTTVDANHALVRNLIDLHDECATIVQQCFGNHQVFQKALKMVSCVCWLVGVSLACSIILYHCIWIRFNDLNCFFSFDVLLYKQAFEDFINRDARVSKMLARFVNDVLKKHNKIATTKEILEKTLDHVVFLYGYISEKDVFERDYQYYLSHRLLMGLCESEHSEKSMIAKLKTECGYQWTNKLEGLYWHCVLICSAYV